MAMLDSIKIEGYRCFDRFEATGFTRINLIVGKNDVGKTALLEALEIALAGGHPGRLFLQSQRRHEFHRAPGTLAGFAPPGPWWDTRQWFHGRDIREGSVFTITPTPGAPTQVSILKSSNGALMLKSTLPAMQYGWQTAFFGGVLPNATVAEIVAGAGPEPLAPRSLDTRLLNPKQVGELWDEAVRAGTAADVAAIAKFVDPEIANILVGDPSGESGWGGVVATLNGKPVPVASLGEGVKRAFVLALVASTCSGSEVLVDEIDAGLHYSVFPDLWERLGEILRQLDVQLFATTHSDDCLRGLVEMLKRRPDLKSDVSLHRLERGSTSPVRSSGGLLVDAIETYVEVR